MEIFEELLTNPLLSITKRYLSLLVHSARKMDIDRYHHVIVMIDDKGGLLSQKTLTELLEIDKSYTVTIVNYLSDHGYVMREQNSSDKRGHILTLTEKAKKALPDIRKAIVEVNKETFKNLSVEEVKIFNGLLNVIRKNLSNSLFSDTHIQTKPSPTKS